MTEDVRFHFDGGLWHIFKKKEMICLQSEPPNPKNVSFKCYSVDMVFEMMASSEGYLIEDVLNAYDNAKRS